MPFTAATTQPTVESAREALMAAARAIELYIQTNNPGLLASADAACTAAKTAITTLQT